MRYSPFAPFEILGISDEPAATAKKFTKCQDILDGLAVTEACAQLFAWPPVSEACLKDAETARKTAVAHDFMQQKGFGRTGETVELVLGSLDRAYEEKRSAIELLVEKAEKR